MHFTVGKWLTMHGYTCNHKMYTYINLIMFTDVYYRL